MKPFVMFGFHPLFNDYADAIHASGGFLSRIVLNIPLPERAAGERFEDCLERYRNWVRERGSDQETEVLWLRAYSPRPEERPVLGFRGPKSLPLVLHLRKEFNLSFPPLVHPAASVSPMAELEEGVFVGAGAVVASHARIGAFSLINRGATVGHDTVADEFVIVSPSAAVASWAHLGRGCILGIGSTVIEHVRIGEGSYVAAGSVVLKNVPPERLVAGVPAVEKKTLSRK